jgi:hypothetical protein
MSEFLIELGNAMMIAGAVLLMGLVIFYFWLKRFNDRLEATLTELIEQLEDQMVGLEVEVDNGLYYCYNSKDKQFVCQGADAREIIDRFQARYPDKTAFLAGEPEDPAVKELVEQLIKLKDDFELKEKTQR